MIDPESCKTAEAVLNDAIVQLMEFGRHLAATVPVAGATLSAQARQIGEIAEDVAALAKASQILERRAWPEGRG